MSLSALINGADCGPVNPLQGLSKQLDRDRGVQQDHFASSSRAGPSRQNFRTIQQETAQSSRFAQEASAFFANAQAGSSSFALAPPNALARPFDLSALTQALPSTRSGSQTPVSMSSGGPVLASSSLANWAVDFQVSTPQKSQDHLNGWASDFGLLNEPNSTNVQHMSTPMSGNMPYQPMPYNPMMCAQPSYNPLTSAPLLSPSAPAPAISAIPDWASQFAAAEAQSQTTSTPEVENTRTLEPSDLPATAALLLNTVRKDIDSNPKFQNSEFMNLMRRIRDREAVVEGNDIISVDGTTVQPTSAASADWANDFASSGYTAVEKGKGRAVQEAPSQSGPMFGSVAPNTTYNVAPSYFQNLPPEAAEALRSELGGATEVSSSAQVDRYFQNLANQLEDDDAELLDEDYAAVLGKDYMQSNDSLNGAQLYEEWGRMAAELDTMESMTQGEEVRSGSQGSYKFQEQNPYLDSVGSAMLGNQPSHHLPFQSVLQTEAQVQRDLRSASAWFDLGVKQQSNEREDQAIQALTKALEIDPTYADAWLAIAVSYTNENQREDAIRAIERWIGLREGRPIEPGLEWRGGGVEAVNVKHGELVDRLMRLARESAAIDANVQIALGVLLNMTEDYAKARDCFQTALAMRPDDSVLYNRVGATLANSGQAQEALNYYYRALELNPSYIRARFNLGISCINLKMFEDAAQNILDALVLQEHDSISGSDNSGSGISSSSLWDSLRTTSMHLHRSDLVMLCEKKDLQGYRMALSGETPNMVDSFHWGS